jgi:hypothetical protein
MSARKNFRELAKRKVLTVRRLIAEGEWEVAAYIMGYVLECALKAATCKVLNLSAYPPIKLKDGNQAMGFKTHDFDQLLVISGLSDVFDFSNYNWSTFTAMYQSDWTQMRYVDMSDKMSETTVKLLASCLYDSKDSIISVIKRKRKW